MEQPADGQIPTGGVLLGEAIDPMEVQRALRALRRLRATLKSETLRRDVDIALDRVSRIRFVEVPRSAPTGPDGVCLDPATPLEPRPSAPT